jgi:hypothetical protein
MKMDVEWKLRLKHLLTALVCIASYSRRPFIQTSVLWRSGLSAQFKYQTYMKMDQIEKCVDCANLYWKVFVFALSYGRNTQVLLKESW